MPIVPALVVGILALVLLAVNIANQSAFLALTSVAIIMFYLAYLGVTGRCCARGCAASGRKPDHGPVLLARPLGMRSTSSPSCTARVVAVDIAWPRPPCTARCRYQRTA